MKNPKLDRLTERPNIKSCYNIDVDFNSEDADGYDFNCSVEDVVCKLGQYEDNDERLGIDYNTLIIALLEGVYVLKDGAYHYSPSLSFDDDLDGERCFEYVFVFKDYGSVYLKDYGKTWVLTKGELEWKED